MAAGFPVRCLCRTRSPVRLLPLLQLILLATHFILVAFQRVRFAVLLEGVNDQIRGYLFPCFVDPSQNVEVFRHRNSLPIDDNGNFDPGVLGDLFVAVDTQILYLTALTISCGLVLLITGHLIGIKTLLEFRVFHHLKRFHYCI